MKIIEAMKLIKELQKKTDDLKEKVGTYCANLDFETPMYPNQQEKVKEWMQSHTDINKEILALRSKIQKTNISTQVEMEIGGKLVKHSIAEWIHRRRDLAKSDMAMWERLTDRGLKEQRVVPAPGSPVTEIKIRRYYDPSVRDIMVDIYRAEPGIIDRTLEVVNAVTELTE